jgi:AcrR family transcriptional regulator
LQKSQLAERRTEKINGGRGMTSPLRKQKDDERKSQTRESLLKAAGHVFAERGYHNTLISDIVAEAGVGQGTFYRFFTSKREIFEALFDRLVTELLGKFSDMSANPPSSLEEYRAASLNAVGRLAEAIDRNREISMLFLRDAPAVDRDFERKLAEVRERFADLAKHYLDHAVSEGFARPCNTEVVAQSLVGIGLHLIEAWFRGRFPGRTREELIEEVVDFAFLGFGLKRRNKT